jgi:arylsulfatase A-like enzyme
MRKLQKLFSIVLPWVIYMSARAAEKPNIVIILADDLGYGDLGYTGSTQIKTPNIDKLAKNGVVFTNGYVTSAVCSPSRAGLMTGRYNCEFGYYTNPDLPPDQQLQINRDYSGLPVAEVTLADRLARLGYINGIIGKWHLGDLPQFHPLKRGFHEFWGYLNGGHDYFITVPRSETKIKYRWPIECNFKDQGALTYLTDDTGNECVDFIKRNKDQPFFLYASFNAPHIPLEATEADKERYSFVKDENRRTYCAMVHRLDVNVGKIMDELKKQDLYNNTVVVFLSDNGGYLNGNISINAPFRGQKSTLFEGGIHVPFVISCPGKFKAGTVYDKPVISLDILPTFVKLAGGEIREKENIHGVDLIPFINSNKNSLPHEYLFWNYLGISAIRHGDMKLINLPDKFPVLYNLKEDVCEQNDILEASKGTGIKLIEKLGMWNITCPEPLFFQGNEQKKGVRRLYDELCASQPNPVKN